MEYRQTRNPAPVLCRIVVDKKYRTVWTVVIIIKLISQYYSDVTRSDDGDIELRLPFGSCGIELLEKNAVAKTRGQRKQKVCHRDNERMPKAASCPGNNEYSAGKYAAESVGTYNIQICIGICIAPYIRIQTKEQAQSENTGKQDCGSSEKCSQRRRSFYKIAVIRKYIV